MNRISERRDARLAGLAAGLFYLCIHSSYYNFDGVACAIAVELSDWTHLVHGNHLAYGVVGWLFNQAWRGFGWRGPALLPLQVLDSALGGAGIGLFYSLLERLKLPRRVRIGAAAGLAVSQAYWFWSLEAQVYMLGAVFVIAAAREAFAEKPRAASLGLLHAGAVLGHVGHLMLAPFILHRLVATRAKARDYGAYAGAGAGSVLAAYAAAAVFAVKPQDFEGLRRWLLGSATLTVERSFTWQGGYSLEGLREWGLTSLKLMVDHGGPAHLGWLLAAAPLAAALFGARRAPRVGPACALWLASYAVLFSTWEPFLDVYRITDLIPLWTLAACALEALPPLWCEWGLAAWVGAAGGLNAAQSILPRADEKANAPYQEALWLDKVTPEDAWVIVTARGQVYVPYFAHRKPLNMRYLDSGSLLREKLDMLTARSTIFVTERTLSEGDWTEALRSYGLAPVREEGGLKLYRVRRTGSPAAGRRKS